MVKLIGILCFMCFAFLSKSQHIITGFVTDGETKEPIENVLIQNQISNEWAMTDKNGKYSIQLTSDRYILVFSYTGMETKEVYPEKISNNQLNITLTTLDLNVEDVVVTAVPMKEKVGSVIKFNELAIEQNQAFSITDVLQQLPGQTIAPPNLDSPNSVTLRSVNNIKRTSLTQSQYDNAFGLSYVIDGNPITNDADMQSFNASTHLGNGATSFDNTNKGIDARTVSIDNIESIEVVEGIPDAEYTNLTTGVVKVKTKTGKMPYTLRAKLNAGTTSTSITKGWNVNKLGDVNVSFSYLNSNHDPRNSLSSFNRINAQLSWTKHQKSKLKNTLQLKFGGNFDDVKVDADTDDGAQRARYRRDRNYSISNNTNLKLNKKWIDQVKSNLSFSYSKQHSYSQFFVNTGGAVVPISLQTGLFNGSYTPVSFLSIREIKGKPINGNANISASKKIANKTTENTIKVGTTITYIDNLGAGNPLDANSARSEHSMTGGAVGDAQRSTRSVNYKNYVKGQLNYGAYIQNDFLHEFANQNEVYLKLGLRYDNQNGHNNVSPRINAGYELNEQLSVRAGVGFVAKTQSLGRLFPGDSYYDILMADFRTSKYSWNLVQTYRYKTPTQTLEPTTSWKYEAGLNYNNSALSATATAYYSNRKNGVRSTQVLVPIKYPLIEYHFADPQNQPPTYTVTGYEDIYRANVVYENVADDNDYGMNMLINIKPIKAIHTGFNITGSYVRSSNSLGTLTQIANNDNNEFAYGLYESSPSSIEQIRSKVIASHHIHKIALLVSVTAEQFWLQRKLPQSFSNISDDLKYQYPLGYISDSGETVIFTNPIEGQNTPYKDLWITQSIEDQKTPFYGNYHLRVSKNLKNGLSTSFNVVNFLNARKRVKEKRIINGIEQTGNTYLSNSPINFGGSVTYKF